MKFFPKTVDSQFLVRVIKNEVSLEEREFFESWLQESEDHKEEFGNFILLWDNIGNVKLPVPPPAEEQFMKIKSRIASLESVENRKSEYPLIVPSQGEKSIKNAEKEIKIEEKNAEEEKCGAWKESWSSILYSSLRIAASIAVVFCVYYLFSRVNSQGVKEPVKQAVLSPRLIEKVNLKGERSTVLLPDGTIVYLNSNSRLVYPKAFSGPKREVELLGEAYFDVAHNRLQPFIVKTGETYTEVVGTEFDLKYRRNKLNLVVTQGKVKAYKNLDESVSIPKGEMVAYSPASGFSTPVKVDIRRYTAWRNNKLSFVHAPLTEVMNEIENFYNVQVVYKNKFIKNKTLTGIFESDSLDNILSMISLTMEMDVKREGKLIVVR